MSTGGPWRQFYRCLLRGFFWCALNEALPPRPQSERTEQVKVHKLRQNAWLFLVTLCRRSKYRQGSFTWRGVDCKRCLARKAKAQGEG